MIGKEGKRGGGGWKYDHELWMGMGWIFCNLAIEDWIGLEGSGVEELSIDLGLGSFFWGTKLEV